MNPMTVRGGESRPVGTAEWAETKSVHNVHTLGFGSGRTPAGLGRIAGVIGGVAEIPLLEPGSSPTSGTVFSLFRGLRAAECVQISSYGPRRGPIFVGAVLLAGRLLSLLDGRFVHRCLFMDIPGLGNVTGDGSELRFFRASLVDHRLARLKRVAVVQGIDRQAGQFAALGAVDSWQEDGQSAAGRLGGADRPGPSK